MVVSRRILKEFAAGGVYRFDWSRVSKLGLDRRRQLGRPEAVRPGLADEGDAAVAPDQDQTVGPAAVGGRDRVVDVVDEDRDPRLQPHGARVRRRCALVERDGSTSAMRASRLTSSTQPSSGCASRM